LAIKTKAHAGVAIGEADRTACVLQTDQSKDNDV